MIEYALGFAYLAFGAALVLNLWRLAQGPSAADRILALDTMVINGIALVILIGVSQATAVYFEAAMLLSLVGFVSTVALTKFILRGDVIE
ncbi:K+/H+ antiporter subunit F [Rubrimonas cliftonensis]|uniref:Multisubunit potassium/proton antiporter, PhaF subunit n=1 Tax=Rubrimonas cliftonensis TaxID=89524 RepID=A0A1H3WLF9_9RHOB|nr:K+/H+ antiporter subunit F [Rubrimonas cliftonensis]SDZ87987.1 multisubunit potassium/proton antiporter, PhaF subunit [Rubrimonas cliftonensis]